MTQHSEFTDFILEQLEPYENVRVGRMFGGYSLYKDDISIGIIFEDTLYLKVDENNQPDFEAMGSTPFIYEKKGGKMVTVSNWKVPAEILEDQDEFIEWAKKAYAAALRKKRRPKTNFNL